MKRKGKWFLFAALLFAGLGSALTLLTPTSNDVTIEDFGPHKEADFSNGGAQSELAPEDRWMLQFIDPPKNVDPTSVYTFECELISRKPETLTTTCADFGEVVYKIKWSSWGVNGAEGTGVYSVNNCDPNCAEGTRDSVPVNVYLSDITSDCKSFFLNTFTFTPRNGYLAPGSYVTENGLEFSGNAFFKGKEFPAITWDLASFYREVPDMRTELP